MGRKIPVLVPFLFSRVTRPCCRENSALSSMTTRPCSREDKKVPCRAFVCRVTQVVRRGASQLRHGSVRMLKNHDDAGRRFSLFPLPFPWLAQFVLGGAKILLVFGKRDNFIGLWGDCVKSLFGHGVKDRPSPPSCTSPELGADWTEEEG